VKIRFEPRDAWVGFWFDTKGRRVFCCPLPFVAISWKLADPAAIRRYTDARRALITHVTAGRLGETEQYARQQDFWTRLDAAALAGGLR
jgi:hypothetical protein